MRLFQRAVLVSSSVVAAALFLFTDYARAADAPACKPLRLINSIEMSTNSDRSRFYVPVSINGTPKSLLLDTGGQMTQISQKALKELKLEDTYSKYASGDLAGDNSDRAVRVATFDLGNLRGENMKFHVAPFPKLPGEAAGILSADLFLQYDVDMDFGANRLNYFSQDHCEGRVAYWPERPLAILPGDFRNGYLIVDVTLDGKVFQAILDTGAPVTTAGISEVISNFHLTPGSPELPEYTPVIKEEDLVKPEDKDKPHWKSYSHKFERLSFGDITVLNPQVDLLPETIFGGPLSNHGTIVIGINVLRQLHIYIAYGEKKLYITPAGNSESALFKATAVTPH
jgi:predicted aspartyl protease